MSTTTKTPDFSTWPKKGSRASADQPFEADDNGGVELTAHPILTSGSADIAVSDLGKRLAALGFENSASRGENPFNIVDGSVMAAVRAFRKAYGVREPTDGFEGDQEQADRHIGPWTATAIVRASDR